ncbi:ammonia-forming cytochrome c nitrite reductase subunit c552 [Anatilimnocola floriformis]|uniref:ammonia-forming cytochrome c nitrite reductase subunit c552 n=1 Tax=Anatilimnocola floriformis TaxID=2948575 RepID=UPI0020C3021F|nr:HEAT repeat domain-containing protein [Anatilimnocola floriformis]
MARRPSAKDAVSIAPALVRRPPARGFWIMLSTAAVVMMAVGGLAADYWFGIPDSQQAKFVGREACAKCHQTELAKFTGSHHDLAMDLATEKTVLADFDDAQLTHYGVTSKMFRRDGKYFINTEGPDGKLADFEIKYVFGVTPLQQYMVEFDRPAELPANEIARLQVLRVSWDTIQKKWFHLDPPDVKDKLAPDDMLHWTGFAQCWNHMCADCHSTNLQKNYDVATGVYHTTFSEIDVSCEACHGPGSLHVQLASAVSPFWDRKHGHALAKLKGTDNKPQVEMCANCHSRRRGISPNFQAGCGYYDYFANELLPRNIYHADGQILDEVYEYGSFVQSKMFHKGIRCTDCHDPHSVRLKADGNKVCTNCHQHPAAKYDTPNHHRHKEGSTGASCVECHMPATTYMEVDPRRDHSLRIPRPDLSVQLGTGNACTACHLKLDEKTKPKLEQKELKSYAAWQQAAERGDATVKAELNRLDKWADDACEKWYGKQRKKEPHFAEALHAARENEPGAEEKLVKLLGTRTMPAIARATAALELRTYLNPQSEGGVTKALADGLKDSEIQVRAACILALQGASDPMVRKLLLPMIDDPSRLVRTEAARILARIPDADIRGDKLQRLREVWKEFEAGASIMNDRAEGHLQLGVLAESRNQLRDAQRHYETAIRVQPSFTGPRGQLAMLLERMIQEAQEQAEQASQQGNVVARDEALRPIPSLHFEVEKLRQDELSLVERDAALIPEEAVMQQQLGFARYTQNWRKEAATALLTAWLLDPHSPETTFALAIFYRDTGWPEKALEIISTATKDREAPVHLKQLEGELKQQLSSQRPAGPARN